MTINKVLDQLEGITGVVQLNKNGSIYYSKFTHDEKNVLVDKLIALGGVVTEEYPIVSDSYVIYVEIEGVSYRISYSKEKTNEEKCAELKQQLADLGCHY